MTAVTTTHPLVVEHAAAIARREDAKTAGVAAGASRRIAALELEMTIQGIEFDPWTPPKPASKPTRSDADLTARLDVVRQIANGDYPASIKATASQEVARLTGQAVKRGIELPTPKATKRTKVAA